MYERKETVRLKDIAEKLGLSIGTVQRALNNKGGYTAETQARIIDEAKKMGYIVNSAASSLRRSPVLIGVVLPIRDGRRKYFFNDIWSGVLQAEEELGIQNIQFLNFETETGLDEFKRLSSIQNLRGIITHESKNPEVNDIIASLRSKSIPVFSIDGDPDENKRQTGFSITVPNQGRLAEDIFKNFVKSTSGTVLLLAGNKNQGRQQKRITEFTGTLSREMPHISVMEFHITDNREEIYSLVLKLLQSLENVIGMYAVSALETITMCKLLRQSGKSGSVIAIGTDMFGSLLPFFEDRTLTATVYQNPKFQSYQAVKMLSQKLISPNQAQEDLIIPASAVFRSTAKDFCTV